jgi:hypothetical protein
MRPVFEGTGDCLDWDLSDVETDADVYLTQHWSGSSMQIESPHRSSPSYPCTGIARALSSAVSPQPSTAPPVSVSLARLETDSVGVARHVVPHQALVSYHPQWRELSYSSCCRQIPLSLIKQPFHPCMMDGGPRKLLFSGAHDMWGMGIDIGPAAAQSPDESSRLFFQSPPTHWHFYPNPSSKFYKRSFEEIHSR